LKWDSDAIFQEIASLKTNQQRKMRALSGATGIPNSTINLLYCRDGIIRQCTNDVEPLLTEHNKYLRIACAGDHIDKYNNNTGLMNYKDYKSTSMTCKLMKSGFYDRVRPGVLLDALEKQQQNDRCVANVT
jgi:hypothetical protein